MTDESQGPERVAAEPSEEERDREDEAVDEMSEESFPASDPPSTWGGEPHSK